MKGQHAVIIILSASICFVQCTYALVPPLTNTHLPRRSGAREPTPIERPQPAAFSRQCYNRRPRQAFPRTLMWGQEASETTIVPSPSESDAKKSKLALEFFGMMDEFAQYTERDIASVDNPRFRALFEGVQAGATEPYVLRAFEVLFEDLAPLRVAGRMIYRNLKDLMMRSVQQRQEQETNIQTLTGLTLDQIDDGRKAFMKIAADGEGELTMGQLVDAGVVETVVELLGYADFDELIGKLDQDRTGKLNFEEFMIGLQRCTAECDDTVCNITDVLEELQKRMEKFEAQQNTSPAEKRKQKYNARYNEMVRSFMEWEGNVPSGDGRMIDILRGCFAGAKNEKVVNALRIVYTDYSALRLSGDLIFGLMEKLVKARRKK